MKSRQECLAKPARPSSGVRGLGLILTLALTAIGCTTTAEVAAPPPPTATPLSIPTPSPAPPPLATARIVPPVTPTPAVEGPSAGFPALPCQASATDPADFETTIGSAESEARMIVQFEAFQESDCIRLLYSFVATVDGVPDESLSTSAPRLDVSTGVTSTSITLPDGFEPGVFGTAFETIGPVVSFEDVDPDGVRHLQLLHVPGVVRAQVLEDPPRLVVDILSTGDDGSAEFHAPVVGLNAILTTPIDPDDAGFVVGDPITISGWLNPRFGSRPYFRVLALRESAAEARERYEGAIPFLAAEGPLEVVEDVAGARSWVPFEITIETESWFGASHAIILGDINADFRFLGSGQIVQFIDADGGRLDGYNLVPTEPLVDADPTSWVKQG